MSGQGSDPETAPAIQAQAGSLAAHTITNSTIHINSGADSALAGEAARELEALYLERLRRDSGALDWLAAVGYQDRDTPAVTLGSVYTALLTNRPDPRVREHEPMSGERRLSAVGVLNMERYLVLTGDPGSGKSAFVNFLALCLAGGVWAPPRRTSRTSPSPCPARRARTTARPAPSPGTTVRHCRCGSS